MSPAGSSDSSEPEKRLVLRPSVTKTFVKGIVGIAIFSLFLQIAHNLINYFIFLALTFGMLGMYMVIKHGAKFQLGEENVVIKRVIGKSNTVRYQDIVDMSVAQGLLAKRFKCGSVYLILQRGRGSANLMGGGVAERLDDVPNPSYVFDLISSRLGMFSPPGP
jgi:hypothetical protein